MHMDDSHSFGGKSESKEILNELRVRFDIKASDAAAVGQYGHIRRERLTKMYETFVRPGPWHVEQW